MTPRVLRSGTAPRQRRPTGLEAPEGGSSFAEKPFPSAISPL